ncbi:hypothetical protein DB32_001674 [Sandaracinus amylolyticus]|uniref:HTH araC/xylS-type domain-containing protein n=1 Tax=Sandaracinus amylolyticus TaxID=927083 RepID=A0A0F6W0Q0_9BACT|nr:hypothetical protein DB32_001674 [Sandaracinus amylolyticus]
MLLLTHDDALTVSEVAQRVGIPHFGRFSVYYRQRFGETPTQTLGRSFGARSTQGETQVGTAPAAP